MGVDASIYGQIRQPEPTNRLAELAQVMQVQGMQQAGQLNSLKMDEYRRGVERSNKLRELLAGGAGEEDLMRGGFLEEATKLGKDRRENLKSDEETAGKRVERAIKTIGMYRDGVFGVQSPEQAATFVQTMLQDPALKDTPFARLPVDGFLPKSADPAGFDAWKKEFALGAQEFIKQNAPKITTQNLGGTSRIVATPGLGGAPTVLDESKMTATPGDLLTDQRVRSEGFLNRQQQSNLAAQGVTYQTNADGSVVALPSKVAPGQTITPQPVMLNGQSLKDQPKVPPAFTNSMTGINELRLALDTYAKALEESGGPNIAATGEARAKLQTAYTALKMGLKNAFELGALTGPDVGVLEGMLADPTGMKTLVLGSKGITEQIEGARRYLGNREKALETTYGRKNPATPKPPETQNAAAPFTDAAKERRYQEWKARQGAGK